MGPVRPTRRRAFPSEPCCANPGESRRARTDLTRPTRRQRQCAHHRRGFTLTEVLDLTQKLREAGMHLTLRAGIISTDRPRRQGKPPESGLLRDRQRTLATFTFPDPDTYDPQTVDALLERNGWHQHGQRVVLTSSGGARRVLVLVEYDIEEQLTRRPWWPAQPQHLAQAAGPQREAA